MWEDWGKSIVAKGFERLPKVQNIAQSGHTGCNPAKLRYALCNKRLFQIQTGLLGQKSNTS